MLLMCLLLLCHWRTVECGKMRAATTHGSGKVVVERGVVVKSRRGRVGGIVLSSRSGNWVKVLAILEARDIPDMACDMRAIRRIPRY
jgi:hypothetical protein